MPIKGIAVLAVLAFVALAAPAAADGPAIPPAEALRITPHGIVWFHEGTLSLLRGGARKRLATGIQQFPSPPFTGGSDGPLVVNVHGELLAGSPPRPLRSLPPESSFPCGVYGSPRAASATDLVFVSGGHCATGRRSIKALPFKGGHQRTLRKLGARTEPSLAARGSRFALGIPISATTMRYEVRDVHRGKLLYALRGPAGSIELDESGRLLIAAAPRYSSGGPFSLSWTNRGLPLLPIADDVYPSPAFSRGRVAYQQIHANGTGTLKVTRLLGRRTRTRRIIGFNSTFRELFALDLRRSKLAWVQSEAALLPPQPRTCYRISFGPKHVVSFDLRKARREIPAPPTPQFPPRQIPCG